MTLTKTSTQGLYTATTTPMNADGSLNLTLIGAQVEKQLRAGISAIVAVGGTGEASALSVSERVDVVRATVEAVAGRVPVVAGITTPGLPDTLALGRAFLDAGADGLMVITPYGTAPSQSGIRDYYKAVADGLGQAVMLYDIPYLTLVTTHPETVLDIANDGSIFAMKASNPDQSAFTRLVQLVGDKIAIMSGDEHLFAVQIALGAVGGVLASTNVLPRTWVQIMETARAGDLALAQHQIARIRDFLVNVYAEPNPGPMKAAQALTGFDVGPVRLPNRAPEATLVGNMRAQLTELLAYEEALAV
ncbi:dihydrodipicolinate synthase family protein [Agrobacterium rhizogenes]|uniref:dihydrodipicolinate synthase family protein n=1 Tax=Rhizobium rhizogenes TaxID=359 RepID=UPI0022B60E62|nr:dihydrodipicolinate synthase family protein [Rhizobium rhizogenes]MCZ7450890.1 dihydrodipicolinate synthase family protein [Rhizobium rhizogenes]